MAVDPRARHRAEDLVRRGVRDGEPGRGRAIRQSLSAVCDEALGVLDRVRHRHVSVKRDKWVLTRFEDCLRIVGPPRPQSHHAVRQDGGIEYRRDRSTPRG